MKPAILGTGTALPPTRHLQSAILDRLALPVLGGDERTARIFRNSGVESRHSVFEDIAALQQNMTTAERNAIWVEHAPALAALAARRCLENAGVHAREVDELITISCTGVDTPGPDLRIAADLGLRPDLRRAHIGSMGCYAALPALYRAWTSVRAQPAARVLVVAVELCTIHFQHDPSIENRVVTALFGDGAGAALVGSRRDASDGPVLRRFGTWTDVRTLGQMGFHLTDRGMRMRLSAEVPDSIGAMAPTAVASLLEPEGLVIPDVAFWLVHPGGVRILDAAESSLGLPAGALDRSREILRLYGNLSSATVLFLLDAYRREGRPYAGRPGVVAAFGPGLTMESALIDG